MDKTLNMLPSDTSCRKENPDDSANNYTQTHLHFGQFRSYTFSPEGKREEVHTCHELLVYIGDLVHIIAREHNNYIHEKNDGILILDIHVHPICWS